MPHIFVVPPRKRSNVPSETITPCFECHKLMASPEVEGEAFYRGGDLNKRICISCAEQSVNAEECIVVPYPQ